jgi:outer membrane receptor protein involved in Fe transport
MMIANGDKRSGRGYRYASSWKMIMYLCIVVPTILFAGTTGKIAGRIIDAETKEPLIGANVVVQGLPIGATTDVDGFYTINNIPPGAYSVVASMLSYRRTTMTDVVIKIDLTTRVDIKMSSEALQGQEVIVRAERPLVQKDVTSTSVIVSAEELKRVPMENLGQIINVQAGVVGGHFRGGRSNEVAYLIDGVAINDPYSGTRSIEIENTTIREMEVVSGTFNAEYGQAMSGIVNIVSQEGSQKYHVSLSTYGGDYVTSHTDVFSNVATFGAFRIKNFQGSLSGPVPFVDGMTFYLNGRYYDDQGYLYGTRVYNTTDVSPFILKDRSGTPILDPAGNQIYIYTHTGDGASVPMNPSIRQSINGKIAYSIDEFKFTYSLFYDTTWNKYYDHAYAWTPDGIQNHKRSDMVQSFQITHTMSANMFQTLKFSYNDFRYKGYLYENSFDSNYVEPSQGAPISGYAFHSGGNQTGRYNRYSKTIIGQWALTSQLTSNNKVGMGVEYRQHEIYNHGMDMINKNTVEKDSITGGLKFVIGYPQLGSSGNQEYTKKPYEFSAYVQDKIEYDMMIVNAGVRFDYFLPNSSYPYDLRNPANNKNFPNAGVMKAASAKVQVSPRLGVSFPITDNGILHFSYGHFFQIPSFENLYYNSDYLITARSSLSNILGNPDLEAQRTVQYEFGLQQAFSNSIGLDFSVYYRDIRNLLGMEILNTYEGFKYARFINRDYANIKGFILSFDRKFTDFYSIRVDYTYQVAEGNASDPYAEYYNNQTDPPIPSNKMVVPLNWDQRSTLNISVTVGKPGDWNVGAIMQFGAGFPYTEDIRVSNGIRFENGGKKPTTMNLDLRAEKTFEWEGVSLTAFALIYNVLDIKNENYVDAASGRANVDLFTYLAGTRYALNTIEQYVNNPGNFSTPRQIRLGVTLEY